MPTKPPTPCAYPGCPTLTRSRRCKAHRGRSRSTVAKRGYGARWRRIRDRKLHLDPWCEICLDADAAASRFAGLGIPYLPEHPQTWTPAELVDHMMPLPEGDHGLANLMSLCRKCHARKTAWEKRRARGDAHDGFPSQGEGRSKSLGTLGERDRRGVELCARCTRLTQSGGVEEARS